MSPSAGKEVLKALRETRKASIARARKSIKAQNKIISAIRKQIIDEPKTIPEIAQATGMESAQVLLFVSALKKYGEVAEGVKDGDYFTYGLVK
ncbi:MAG: hypothetical protein PVI90_16605 [Desulfobacteraceae bacterium]|jgi:predicted Rossmann fold nucleotide-binding protein DprA/Smf involved in DNA uptake